MAAYGRKMHSCHSAHCKELTSLKISVRLFQILQIMPIGGSKVNSGLLLRATMYPAQLERQWKFKKVRATHYSSYPIFFPGKTYKWEISKGSSNHKVRVIRVRVKDALYKQLCVVKCDTKMIIFRKETDATKNQLYVKNQLHVKAASL